MARKDSPKHKESLISSETMAIPAELLNGPDYQAGESLNLKR